MYSSSSSCKGGPDSTFNDALIKEVRRNPVIYDCSHPQYGNAIKKQEAWAEIAANLNEKVEIVKTRWRTLRDRYTKERRRVLTCGVGSSFSYYADLCFLDSFHAENRAAPSKRKISTAGQSDVTAVTNSEVFKGFSDTACIFDQKRRMDNKESEEYGETDHSSENITQPTKPKISLKTTSSPIPNPIRESEKELGTADISEIPSKHAKLDSSPDPPSDTVAKALMRSAEALQRLAERKSIFDRSTSGPRDADECFADFVCMSLKSIDNESRVHARIAILHALAQFQT